MNNNETERLTRAEDKIESNTRRIEECEGDISELKKTYTIMEKMDYRIENMENSVDSINKKIDEGQKQKGLKWDKLIDYLFYAILAFALFKLGIK